MALITDFHTHILPGVDDGSPNVQTSLEMLRAEADQGIEAVVLTPHFYPQRHRPESFLQRRADAYAALTENLPQGMPRLHLGAEVYYYRGMSHTEQMHSLAIDGGEYLLVEMPWHGWADKDFQELTDIHENLGLTPVIAHIDRYITRSNAQRMMDRLADMPVLVQANASFFTGLFTRKMALRFLSEGRIHLLGSDCHNLDKRPPILGDVMKKITEKVSLEAVHQTAQQILLGQQSD